MLILDSTYHVARSVIIENWKSETSNHARMIHFLRRFVRDLRTRKTLWVLVCYHDWRAPNLKFLLVICY
jgi:hypothetical protein